MGWSGNGQNKRGKQKENIWLGSLKTHDNPGNFIVVSKHILYYIKIRESTFPIVRPMIDFKTVRKTSFDLFTSSSQAHEDNTNRLE